MGQEVTIYADREWTFDEQCLHIMAQLASGRSVSTILREDAGMPPAHVFWYRLYKDDDLYQKISRARDFGADACVEQATHIAMTPHEGVEYEEGVGPQGPFRKIKRGDMLGHRKLAVDTLLKRAQMIAPRKYGPKLDLTSDGEKIGGIADAIAEGNKRLQQQGGE